MLPLDAAKMRAPADGGSMVGTRARVRIRHYSSGEDRQHRGALAPETEGRNAQPGSRTADGGSPNQGPGEPRRPKGRETDRGTPRRTRRPTPGTPQPQDANRGKPRRGPGAKPRDPIPPGCRQGLALERPTRALRDPDRLRPGPSPPHCRRIYKEQDYITSITDAC